MVAAVASVEGADHVVLFPRIDVVRADESQRVAEPMHGLGELRRHQHGVPDPLHVRRPARQPHQLARALKRIFAGVEFLPRLDLDRRQRRDAVHDLDLVAVGLGEPHAFPAAGLVDRFDAGCSRSLGQPLEIVLARGVVGHPDEARVALFGDVDMMGRIGPAHVERLTGPLHLGHSEPGEEFLHLIEIGGLEPPVSYVHRLDPRHLGQSLPASSLLRGSVCKRTTRCSRRSALPRYCARRTGTIPDNSWLPRARRMLGAQSALILASLITLLHFSASALMSAAYCSGEPAIGCSVLGRRTFWRYSVSAKMRRISPLSLAMISPGVPLGANSPNQERASKPGTPLSATVGKSGNSARRCALAIARSLTRPARHGSSADPMLTNIIGTWP